MCSKVNGWCGIEAQSRKKTEYIIIGNRQARDSLIQNFPTQLLANSISPTNTVKNLGVTFDSGNTFISHITKVCHACDYHLEDLRCIRKILSVETAVLLANAVISSLLATVTPYSMA